MKAGSVAAITVGLWFVSAGGAAAQRLPPLPPPPVSLTVPRPIPPISTTPAPPRDLYQQLTPPQPVPPVVIYNPGGLFFPSVYTASGYPPGVDTAQKPSAPQPLPRGGLRFETVPGSAQVFVDGFYVGVIDDFGISGHALDLEASPHRVEVRATGYATLEFTVRILPNQTVRYRGDLQRLSPAPPPMAGTPAAQKAVYVIPRCYAGDKPPARVLPPGCDPRRMIVQKP